MSLNLNRQPAGTPTGGQFAAGATGESSLVLENYPMEPHDTMAAPIDELRAIDADERELFEAGIKPDSRAVQGLVAQRKQILSNMLLDAEHVELDSDEVAGKVIAYAKDGTLVFTDGTYSRADGPILPCGHDQRTAGCGGCDHSPGGTEFVIEDGSSAWRPYDTAPNSTDARVQAGEVFDQVHHHDHGMFYRRRDGVYPNVPYAMRFQADRPLSDDEVQQAAQLIGYNYAAQVRGESISDPQRDSPYSFIVCADSTKSRSDDLGYAMERFEDDLPKLLSEGSPVRKTDRAGFGTAGTRLVDGFGQSSPKLEVYYDSVGERLPR